MSHVAVTSLLARYGTTHVANAMGVPISTLHAWKINNSIPGQGKLREMRVQALLAAVEVVKVTRGAKPKKRTVRAAGKVPR